MTRVSVFSNALAKFVTGHSASGRTSDAERLYDKIFRKGGMIEERVSGGYWLLTFDEAHMFNIPANVAPSIFRFT